MTLAGDTIRNHGSQGDSIAQSMAIVNAGWKEFNSNIGSNFRCHRLRDRDSLRKFGNLLQLLANSSPAKRESSNEMNVPTMIAISDRCFLVTRGQKMIIAKQKSDIEVS